jgi:hypothetical protein
MPARAVSTSTTRHQVKASYVADNSAVLTAIVRQPHQHTLTLRLLHLQPAFLQVYTRRFRLLSAPAPHGNFPQELHEKITTLQDITQASTQQQQTAIIRGLWHSPEVLNLRSDTLRDKAAALAEQLQQHDGVTAELVQRLITAQLHVLVYRPEKLAQKLEDMAERLGVLPAVMLSMWLRQRTMVILTLDTFDAKLLELAGMLHLQEPNLQRLVVAAPTLLAFASDSVQARFDNVLNCLPTDTWTAEKLGAALVAYPAVLTYRPESLRRKWDVVSSYAAMHEPSAEQLQKQQQGPAVLNIFTRSDAHISMLEYIMQQQQQQQTSSGLAEVDCSDDSSSSSSSDDEDDDSSSSSSSDDEPALQQQLASSSSSKSSSSSRRTGRTLELLVDGRSGPMPRLLCVLSANKVKQAALQQQYPGFAKWYKQRNEQQRKQKQQRQQQLDDEEG